MIMGFHIRGGSENASTKDTKKYNTGVNSRIFVKALNEWRKLK